VPQPEEDDDIVTDLDIDALPLEELPALITELSAVVQRAAMRLRTASAPASATPMPSRALDVEEVMRRTGMSKGWLYRAARAGHLPFARRLGRRLTFDEAGLVRWLARRPVK
jgi:excisionase family DNA binding protein